jgi:hypothetical protein
VEHGDITLEHVRTGDELANILTKALGRDHFQELHERIGAIKGSPDEDITTSDTTIPFIELQGPITRSRAQQLHHQVNSFLCSSANNLENRLLTNDLIVIRNQKVDHREHVEHQKGVGEPRKHAQHGGSPSQFGI